MTLQHNSSERHDSTRVVDARLHLLDRQVLDCNGTAAATVDDIELAGVEFGDIPADAPLPRIEAICSGTTLATRIFGGRTPYKQSGRISWSDVDEVAITLRLRVARDALDDDWQERWVRNHIIGRIPGGRHAPE